MRLTATELTIAASLARGLDSIERSLASPDEDLWAPSYRTGEVSISITLSPVDLRAALTARRDADIARLAVMGLRWEPSTDLAQPAPGHAVVKATDWHP